MTDLNGKRVGARDRVSELRDRIRVHRVTLTDDLDYRIPDGSQDFTHSVVFTQDATGGHTVTYGGTALNIDTTAAAKTAVDLVPDGAGNWTPRYTSPAGSAVTTAATSAAQRAALGLRLDSSLHIGRVDIDPDEAVSPAGTVPITITTYTGGTNELVHPSVLYFADGWNGYPYWMAYTPYDGGSVIHENPSIAVSTDGDTWVTPPGLTNPVEPYPGGPYNADPNIFMAPDNKTMYMVFKMSIDASTKVTYLRTSTDGITWTPKVELIRNTWEDVSPCVVWDGTQYVMWSVKHVDNPNSLLRRTAPAPEGPWSVPTTCTIDVPGAQDLWHIDIARVGGQYLAVASPQDNKPPFFGVSDDGLSLRFARHTLLPVGKTGQGSFYKCAIVPKVKDGSLSLDFWYGGFGSVAYRVFRSTITFDRERIRSRVAADVVAGVNLLPYYTVVDTFNRADTTAGLGTADTGQAWTAPMGNVMGIASNKAYLPVAANSRSIIAVGSANYHAEITITTLGTGGYFMFRYVDATNWWRFGHSSNQMVLQKCVAGSITTFNQAPYLFAYVNDRWGVRCDGSRVTIYRNGLPVIKLTDSAHATTGTNVGINVDNSAVRFDNLTVRPL